MLLSANEKIITVLVRTLNLVDNRLLDHGKRVAHRVFERLSPLASYSDRELREILHNMKNHHLLDPTVLELAISNFEEITEKLQSSSLPVIKTYEEINKEIRRLSVRLSNEDYDYRTVEEK